MKARKRIAVLVAGESAETWRAEFASEFDVALVTDDPAQLRSAVARSEVGASAVAPGMDAVALCNPLAGLGAQLELAEEFLRCGTDVLLLRPDMPHGIEGLGLVVRRIGGQLLLSLPARRISASVPAMKRLLDLLVSAAVLLAGAPLWLLIATAVKIQDRGPVFFAQDRVGPGGRAFRFLKFRTMWPDADRHRAWYQARHGEPGRLFKLSQDPRRTPVGRVLRRFSLDEVPQLLHVLSGRMALVGPRPPLPAEIERYRPWQRLRLRGWFGLTGLWQVCGRSEVRDLDDVVLLDTLYLQNASLALDLRILLRTAHVVLSGRGAC